MDEETPASSSSNGKNRTRCDKIYQQDMYSATCPLWFYTQGAQWKCSCCLAVFCLICGALLLSSAAGVSEITIAYDHNNVCDGSSKNCWMAFNVETDIPAPAFMYYEIPEIFVNHRSFVQSKDVDIWKNLYSKYYCKNARTVEEALKKRPGDPTFAKLLEGLDELRPCGFTALSLFTDTYKLYRGGKDSSIAEDEVKLDSSKVALSTDWTVYQRKVVSSDSQNQNASTKFQIKGPEDTLVDTFLKDGDWLQHFQVWMRTPASPLVRNLWAVIEDGLPKGKYTLHITENSPIWTTQWMVPEKRVILTHATAFGGGGTFLGVIFTILGVYFLLCVPFFIFAHRMAPSKPGAAHKAVGQPKAVKTSGATQGGTPEDMRVEDIETPPGSSTLNPGP